MAMVMMMVDDVGLHNQATLLVRIFLVLGPCRRVVYCWLYGGVDLLIGRDDADLRSSEGGSVYVHFLVCGTTGASFFRFSHYYLLVSEFN